MTRLERDRSDSLSVPEMLRIMDVATALRQDRELVEEQLNFEALKQRLKERMLAASRVTGEAVTPEEVDAAIDRYYSGLYSFREPKLSFLVALAHLWVRRTTVLWAAWAVMFSFALLWYLFLSPSGPMTSRGRNHARVVRLSASVARQERDLRALTSDPAAGAEVARLATEAEFARTKEDAGGLEAASKALADLESRLGESYTVQVVSGSGRKSAVDRYINERGKPVSGYYLIVEAKGSDGSVLSHRVHNDETGSDERVSTWAERVPEAVYNRLKKDKQEDGILNETAFAVKRKGSLDEEITMPGPDGRHLTRMGRITKW